MIAKSLIFTDTSILRLYPIWAADSRSSKMPFTGLLATVIVRYCTINGSLLLNSTAVRTPIPTGLLTGFIDYPMPLGLSILRCYTNLTNGLVQDVSTPIRVKDLEPPKVTCSPSNVIIYTDAGKSFSTWVWPRNTSTATDNLGVDRTSCTGGPSNNIFIFSSSTTITCFAWDSAGNRGSCAYTVAVRDIQPPSMNCSNLYANTSLNNNTGTVNSSLIVVVDNVALHNRTCYPPLSTRFAIGLTSVYCDSFDTSRNYAWCVFNVLIADRQPPTLSCPSTNISASPTSPSVVSLVPVSATDNSRLPVSVNCTPGGYLSPVLLSLGYNSIKCTATDAFNNSASCSMNATVVDTTPPTPVCNNLNLVTIPQNNYALAPPSFGVTVTDNVHVTSSSCLPLNPNGTLQFTSNNSTVSCNFSDAAKNIATCNLIVFVADNQPPMVTCPISSSVGTFSTSNITVNFTSPVAWDNVAVAYATLSATFQSNTFFLTPNATNFTLSVLGSATMTYTAYDTSGLYTTCFFAVTAYQQSLPPDSIPPTIFNCPTSLILYQTQVMENYNAYNSSFALFTVFTDNGRATGTIPLASWPNITAADNVALYYSGYRDFGPNPSSASQGLNVGNYTVDFLAKDQQGNTADCIFRINVVDIEPPRFANCPTSMMTFYTFNSPTAALTSWPAPDGLYLIDNVYLPVPQMYTNAVCTSSPDNSLCPLPGQLPSQPLPPGIYSFNYTGTDASGNQAAPCRFGVTVIDNSPPSIIGCPTNTIVVRTSPGLATADASALCPTLNITDNCPGVRSVTSSSPPGYNCSIPLPINSIHIQVTAIDNSGLTDTCSIHLYVLDRENPTLSGCDPTVAYTDVSAECDPMLDTAVVTFRDVAARDNSGQVNTTVYSSPIADLVSGSVFPFGVSIVTFVAQDPSENRITCSLRVLVRDTQPPIFYGFPSLSPTFAYVLNTDPNSATASLMLPNITAWDNVALQSFAFQPSTYSAGGTFHFSVGTTTISITASDTSFNTAVVTLVVTVSDNEPPTFISCPSNNTETGRFLANASLHASTALVDWPRITAVDNVDGTRVPIGITSDPIGFTAGSLFRIGETKMTYTAQDSSGNTATCVFDVEVFDIEPPVLLCAESFSVYALSPTDTGAYVTWRAPFVSDNDFVSTFYATSVVSQPGMAFPTH